MLFWELSLDWYALPLMLAATNHDLLIAPITPVAAIYVRLAPPGFNGG